MRMFRQFHNVSPAFGNWEFSIVRWETWRNILGASTVLFRIDRFCVYQIAARAVTVKWHWSIVTSSLCQSGYLPINSHCIVEILWACLRGDSPGWNCTFCKFRFLCAYKDRSPSKQQSRMICRSVISRAMLIVQCCIEISETAGNKFRAVSCLMNVVAIQ